MKPFSWLFIFIVISSYLYSSEATCPQQINIKHKKGYTHYMLGVQSEGVGESLLKWYRNGLVCGYTTNGTLNLTGFNSSKGVLTIQIGTFYSAKYQGILYKNITKKYIKWEGNVKNDNNKKLFTFLKRKRNIAKNFKLDSRSRILKYMKKEGLTEYDYSEKKHGVYYCGDGGCNERRIGILVSRENTDKAIDDIKNLKSLISSVKLADKGSCSYFKHNAEYFAPNINIQNSACLLAKTYPLKEVQATLELNKLNTVLYASRTGGDAGANMGFLSMNGITINGVSYLTSTTQLNASKFAAILDKGLREHFHGQNTYISKPSYQNNSITWKIKGKKSDFTNDISDNDEWWKVQVQAFVSQKNAGDYILGVGLPETRVAKWGLTNTPPSDSKFVKELTNDPMFMNLRGQLIIIFASKLDLL